MYLEISLKKYEKLPCIIVLAIIKIFLKSATFSFYANYLAVFKVTLGFAVVKIALHMPSVEHENSSNT